MTTTRKLNRIDQLITQIDNGLRVISAPAMPDRAYPAEQVETAPLSREQERLSGSLMRVNHTGEVCAQALYQGQALTAKLPNVRAEMEQAAREEVDHLAWCERRLHELNSHTSYLNPLFYAGSFAIGATAGLIGDQVSLGFVAETEDQVCTHLENHLGKLPAEDTKSRAVIEQMHHDEAKHRQTAIASGAIQLPGTVKRVMGLVSKIMTRTCAII